MSLPVYQCQKCKNVGVRPVAVTVKIFGKLPEQVPGCGECGSTEITMLFQAELLRRKEIIASRQYALAFPVEG